MAMGSAAATCVARAGTATIEGMRQQQRQYVPSVLVGSDFFALSFGLDMVDVGG